MTCKVKVELKAQPHMIVVILLARTNDEKVMQNCNNKVKI